MERRFNGMRSDLRKMIEAGERVYYHPVEQPAVEQTAQAPQIGRREVEELITRVAAPAQARRRLRKAR